ncbi:hypothetical protein [Photobacterium sp. R1]
MRHALFNSISIRAASKQQAVCALIDFGTESAMHSDVSWNGLLNGTPDWSEFLAAVVCPVCEFEGKPGVFTPLSRKDVRNNPHMVSQWSVYGVTSARQFVSLHHCDTRAEAEYRVMLAMAKIHPR